MWTFIQDQILGMKGLSVLIGKLLTALGLDPVDVHGSLRISLSPESDKFDIDNFVDVLANAVARLREMSPLWNQEIDYDGVMCKKGNNSCKRC